MEIWRRSSLDSDQFGLRSIMIYAPHLDEELQRLFDQAPCQQSSCSSVWEEFQNNGHNLELDELDQFFLRRSKPTELLKVSTSLRHEPMNSSGETSPTTSCSLDDIMTQAHLIEILRERERLQRTHPAKNNTLVKKISPAVEKICVFCRNNGEPEGFYTNHQLKDAEGNITCPILFIYTCPICGASGSSSHTIKYCPYNSSDSLSVTSLTKTARSAAGKRVRTGN